MQDLALLEYLGNIVWLLEFTVQLWLSCSLLDKKDTVREESRELAIYVEMEIKVVERELLSLHKVMVKLELEMKEAIDTEG